MSEKVVYQGQTTPGPSGAIWGDCPWRQMKADLGIGYTFEDDFMEMPLSAGATTLAAFGKCYRAYNAGAGVVIPVTAMPAATKFGGGAVALGTDTAGDAAYLGTAWGQFLLTGSTATSGKLWYEARIATTQIVTNDAQLFLGLCENDVITPGAAVPLADANATSNTGALIGFNRLEDGLSVINTSYADRAATWTNVQATASTGVLAANTWIKLGMTYDPSIDTDCIKFFVNGTRCTTTMSRTTLLTLTNTIAGTFGPAAAMFADSAGTASFLYLDWWRCAQLRV